MSVAPCSLEKCVQLILFWELKAWYEYFCGRVFVCVQTGSGAVAGIDYAHSRVNGLLGIYMFCVNDGIRDKGEEGISIFK